MPEYERVEGLRQILEREQCRQVTHSEAADIGEMLVDFFEVLANCITTDDVDATRPMQNNLAGVR